ncbi:ABC transporter permease [Microterricola viridarii]|uniref:ABC transporter permease n=1 Tax=Microterricola viridarii TaxID=412690 RepID=A0A0Y0P715_9MICO|nr:ABC transporter permease [Microterricola viridarii]AMB60009.1 ABC transporter permease [Microterricola viridarii]
MAKKSPTPGGAPLGARRGWAGLPFLTPGTLVLALFVFVPLVLVTTYAFFKRGRFGGVVYTFTLDNFARLADPLYLNVIATSIGTALIVTVLAVALGYPTALVIVRLPPKWRTLALVAVLLPFWTNFLIRTYAWILLLNNAGWINQGLQAVGIIDEPLKMLYTQPAVIIGLLYMYLPLMVLPLYASLSSQDAQLTEAATNLGSSPFRVFRTITLPLSVPGLLTGCVFVFVPAMSNFVIPELLGGGKTVLIGNLIRDQFLKARDWPFGAALALVLTILLVALIFAQQTASRRVTEGPRERKVKRNA